MDTWGIGIFIISMILYLATKRKYGFFLFTAGIGGGIVIGAIWAIYIFNNAIDKLIP